MVDIESKLNTAKTLLTELGNAFTNLVNVAPEVFEDQLLKQQVADFRQVYDVAMERLAKPSLRMAMIGTTSSGKSTIVNALMGRRIAPIEAGEMSGGVLSLQHSNEQKLIIEATPDAVWETGEWSNLSDEEIYNKIKAVMHSYHEARRKKEYIAPQVKAYLPLLPACNLELSGLPKEIGIEFLDLPGLKSIQDRNNLSVIQLLVGKAFSLVALDYMQVDEQHRQKLLEELKHVVEYLQGRTDSMIFILNRVDNRGADDLPIEERLEKLKLEIKDVLQLKNLPDIIPFNARLLYYAQCAWGYNSFDNSSDVSPEIRLNLLKAMVKDCASKIEEQVSGKRELRRWFDEIKYDLDDNYYIDDEKVRKIVEYALQWSGGETLWSCIRKRLQGSFGELIIFPILMDVFNHYDSFSNSLNVFIQANKITDLAEITAKQKQLAKTRRDFSDSVKTINEDLANEMNDYITKFQSKDKKIISEALEEAEKKGRKGFQKVSEVFKDIQQELNLYIIAPVKDAFENKASFDDLENKLLEKISPPLAKNIAKGYANVTIRLSLTDFEKKNGYFVKSVKIDDTDNIKKLEHDEKYVRLLYVAIKKGLGARAELILQVNEKNFINALNSMVEDEMKRLSFAIPEDILNSLDMEKAIISDIHNKLNNNSTKLPENFFQFVDNIEQKKLKTVGSCLSERTKEVDNDEDAEYKKLSIPDFNTMVEQWGKGIDNSKDKLWDIVIKWIIDNLKQVNHLFDESLNDMINLVERALDEKSQSLKNNELELENSTKLSIYKDKADDIRHQLAQEFNVIEEGGR